MLDSKGFNLWAGDYDKSVGVSDDNGEYPFAGYRDLMNAVYGTVMAKSPVRVLDIGIGTGTLAAELYKGGNHITGIDFSSEMIKTSALKMPQARLIECDFSQGMPDVLCGEKFDFIISTYALHHLTDEEKAGLILSLFDYLKEDGTIIIGDVSFQTRADLANCKNVSGDDWDDDEIYFVYSEIKDQLDGRLSGKCEMNYQQFSHCSGVLEIHPYID